MGITLNVYVPGLMLLALYIVIDSLIRKKQNLGWRLGFYSMLFYGVMVLQVTFNGIHIPPRSFPMEHLTWHIQPVPFHFLIESTQLFWSQGLNHRLIGYLRPSFLNLLLLAPLGFYLPWLFKIRSVAKVALVAGLISLAIETGQLITTVTGLTFPRSFNVDDLILNTLGAVMAFGVYNFLAKRLPQKRNT